MNAHAKHWTEQSTDDYIYRLSSDFVRQIEEALSAGGENQVSVAKKLGVSEGRVSQVLNNPGNLTLRKMIEYARAVGRKVTVVAYSDNDPENTSGPIDPTIFSTCWTRCGSPQDMFDLQECLPKPLERHHVYVVRVPAYGGYEVKQSVMADLTSPAYLPSGTISLDTVSANTMQQPDGSEWIPISRCR